MTDESIQSKVEGQYQSERVINNKNQSQTLGTHAPSYNSASLTLYTRDKIPQENIVTAITRVY